MLATTELTCQVPEPVKAPCEPERSRVLMCVEVQGPDRVCLYSVCSVCVTMMCALTTVRTATQKHVCAAVQRARDDTTFSPLFRRTRKREMHSERTVFIVRQNQEWHRPLKIELE